VTDNTITGLEPVKPGGWFELRVEGKPPFLVDGEIIYKNALRVGGSITNSEWEAVRSESDLAWLKYKGTRILSHRVISERDLRRKLTEERRPSAAREQAIAHFKEYGLLNDAQFASDFVRAQMARGAKSRLYLRKKLREKGIAEEVVAGAIEEELREFDEVGAVRKMAVKKYKTVKHLSPVKARNRIIAFLRGRGFAWDTIRKAIEGLFAQDEEEED
jgi:regulatory protein